VYLGSASKTLAPALRLGWMVLPAALVEPVSAEKVLADRGTNRIDQHAFAGFLERGELDRHLRRMRIQYRARRDALVAALGEALPEGTVQGVAAGLHVTVRLPDGVDEAAVRAEAQRRGIALSTLGANRIGTGPLAPTLLLGYARLPEATIAPGVRELAAAVRRVAETP
jgi:GntR family transcriptional regulator/MocR family aminotransferase